MVRSGTSYCFKQHNLQWESSDFVHGWNGHWAVCLEQMLEKGSRLFLGGYFGAFPCLTQWPTLSVGSLYWKAPIWPGLKMSCWCLRFLRQGKAARKRHPVRSQSLFTRTQMFSENPCQERCERGWNNGRVGAWWRQNQTMSSRCRWQQPPLSSQQPISSGGAKAGKPSESFIIGT